MASQKIKYEIIGKSIVDTGTIPIYALKVLYKGDGTPWWTCSSGLEIMVNEELFNSSKVGSMISITIDNE